MANQPLRVAVIFGGRSGEHEVSLMSSRAIIAALQRMPERYTVVPIGITKSGRWVAGNDELLALLDQSQGYKPLPEQADALQPVLMDTTMRDFVTVATDGSLMPLDVDIAFPVLHGPWGEDGTVQGLFEVMGMPYVGCGVLASALAMDKIVAKQVFAQVGLPSLAFTYFIASQWQQDERAVVDEIEKTIGYDCFVKPANMGSSVGISKAHNQVELIAAIHLALRYDSRILVEKAAQDFYEIECSVLGNEAPIASVPGEVVPCNEFYDYNAKYLADGSKILIPAPGIDENRKNRVRELAVTAYRALDASGLARVDFLVAKQGTAIWINEVNTLPGFTPISMYPKMWEATGVSFDELVHRLVQFGLSRSLQRSKLADAASDVH